MPDNSKPQIVADFQAGAEVPPDLMDSVATSETQEAMADPTITAFAEAIDKLGVNNQEVVDRKEELQTAGAELIESFGVKPEFFEDDSRAAIFTSLAGNYASAQKTMETDSWAEHMQKKEFVANATFLLTRNYSTNSQELSDLHEKQQNVTGDVDFSEDLFDKVISKYIDPTLSKEIATEAEKGGIFTEVLSKLGIDPKDATPVEVSVLSTGSGYENLSFLLEENGVTYEEARDWAEGLQKRAEDVTEQLPHLQDIELAMRAAGFASTIDGKHHIMIPMGAAEALTAEKNGIKLSTEWFGDKPDRVRALLQHEFTHQQKSTRVEGAFGYTVEERRAEHFSGDKTEYYQEKRFLTNMALLNGKHIVDLFDRQAELRQAGNEVSIYQLLMDTYGVDRTAQIAAAMPAVYMRYENSEFTRGMVQNLGTYEQITASYAHSLSPAQKKEALQRIEDRVDKFSDKPDVQKEVIWQSQQLVEALGGEPIEQKLKAAYKEKLKSISLHPSSSSKRSTAQ